MKLWEKNIETKESVLNFTTGKDPDFDKLLAPFDIIASMAHAVMLGEKGIISKEDAGQLLRALSDYFPEASKPEFTLKEGDEDIHSHLENYLTEKAGEAGKKIHTARSRNDQVMIALQLLMKEELGIILDLIQQLFNTLISQAEEYTDILIPGYTHTQVAMPSSMGIWLGAYAESLAGDVMLSEGVLKVIDQNTLGSAAGFGSSFPIDRELTTALLGFSEVMVSSVSAQLWRGKMETLFAQWMGSVATTLSRLSTDMIFYMGQDLKFISFPDELTTGSSIMPHKKNPDVLELIRAHCNTIIQVPAMLNSMQTNLISGYHRDFQLTKEILFPAIERLKNCLTMMTLMTSEMNVGKDILENEKYSYVFTVEEIDRKVMAGKSFREAYKEVARSVEDESYTRSEGASYTHLGSIGKPGLDSIQKKMDAAMERITVLPANEIFEKLKKYAG